MAEVKKRENIPKEIEAEIQKASADPKPVVITVGDKEFDLPRLTYGHYKKVLKKLENQPEDMDEQQALEYTRDFYFELLKPEHPELKKTDLDEMPIFQYGAEFIVKLKLALFRIPFGS